MCTYFRIPIWCIYTTSEYISLCSFFGICSGCYCIYIYMYMIYMWSVSISTFYHFKWSIGSLPLSFSSTYNCLKYSLYNWELHQRVLQFFASTAKQNFKTQEEEECCVYSLCFFCCSFLLSDIPRFLLISFPFCSSNFL